MGKGTGCIPSKGSKPVTVGSPPHNEKANAGPSAAAVVPNEVDIPSKVEERSLDTPPVVLNDATTTSVEKIKVFIVYYSMYGHVLSLAKKVKEGVDTVEGVQGYLYQVPETLSEDVLTKMSAPPKDASVPIISAHDLPSADAILFGFPTRYGTMAAQMKAFFDSTGSLWKEQKLVGKAAGIFVSTGTQGGGQETTAWTAITQLVHHGMLYVPIGYTFGAGMFTMDDAQGGSPYGAGTFAGDGTRTPTVTELAMAEHQGRLTGNVAKLLARS